MVFNWCDYWRLFCGKLLLLGALIWISAVVALLHVDRRACILYYWHVWSEFIHSWKPFQSRVHPNLTTTRPNPHTHRYHIIMHGTPATLTLFVLRAQRIRQIIIKIDYSLFSISSRLPHISRVQCPVINSLYIAIGVAGHIDQWRGFLSVGAEVVRFCDITGLGFWINRSASLLEFFSLERFDMTNGPSKIRRFMGHFPTQWWQLTHHKSWQGVVWLECRFAEKFAAAAVREVRCFGSWEVFWDHFVVAGWGEETWFVGVYGGAV